MVVIIAVSESSRGNAADDGYKPVRDCIINFGGYFMTKTEMKKIAKKLLIEQIEVTSYSLERDEYKNCTIDEIETIAQYIYKYGQAMIKAIGENGF